MNNIIVVGAGSKEEITHIPQPIVFTIHSHEFLYERTPVILYKNTDPNVLKKYNSFIPDSYTPSKINRNKSKRKKKKKR